jgi:hypothetical protein
MCFEHSPLHDHFQGEVVLPLGHLHRHRALDQWYALARRDKKPVRGEVHLKLELGVDVPENYVRRPSSLDGSDPTVRASMPVGLDVASFRSADDKRVYDKDGLLSVRTRTRTTAHTRAHALT